MIGSHHGTTAGDRDAAGGPVFQVGQVYVDVRRRVLEFLNAAAARLHADGLPFTAADPMIPNLFTADGKAATAADLPLTICWGTAKPVEQHLLWAKEDGVKRKVFWSAVPFPRSGPLAGIIGSVACVAGEPQGEQKAQQRTTEPDWQQLAELAHDLAAPLHSLTLIAEALERTTLAPPDLHKGLEAMQRTAGRALEISSDLLRKCRGPAPRRRHGREWLNFSSCLHNLVEEHTAAACRKGLTLTGNFDPIVGWEVFTDSIPFGRLLSNLLMNAIRYTSMGRIEVSARWRGEPGQSALMVRVLDTGQGIAPEEKESIFQPFTRGKAGTDSNVEGSGLGLAVVERLAAELDLHLEVHTATDAGTTFTLSIPALLTRAATP
jgi:signal transduction histidine kinase